ncbi:MAG: DNA polymerase IV, partial [Oscillospiraceae bacterium]|nr:DNA polymerase IV [Oscillospiraceae bacterium]
LSDFADENCPCQISLLDDENKKQKLESLDKTTDKLKKRFGNYSLLTANLLKDPQLSHFNPYEDHTVHPVSFF